MGRFGITDLYATLPGGKEWVSTWHNGVSRSWDDDSTDTSDLWFDCQHGTGDFSTDGGGVLSISGIGPRMHVHDPDDATSQWGDVEVTCYFMRVADDDTAYSGMEACVRTNHLVDANKCDSRNYGGRFRNDGHVDFEKETSHPDGTQVADTTVVGWTGQTDEWVGYKFVCYDLPGDRVRLELWIDSEEGAGGGTWRLANSFVDTGTNFGTAETACAVGIPPGMTLNRYTRRAGSETGYPNSSIHFRADGVSTDGLLYKWASIREIMPPAAGIVI